MSRQLLVYLLRALSHFLLWCVRNYIFEISKK